MKKIMMSLAMIVAVGAVVAASTGAFFSDTETSTGNTFTAGAIDLTIDSEAHYNGFVCKTMGDGTYLWEYETTMEDAVPTEYIDKGVACYGTWEQRDLDNSDGLNVSTAFFNYEDLKPGDWGENTISLHIDNNDAYGCVTINPLLNDDMSSTEPELDVDAEDTDSIFDGELAQNMHFMIWADICDNQSDYLDAFKGDNIYQAGCDTLLTEGDAPLVPTTWALAGPGEPNIFTSVMNEALNGSEDYYIGVGWDIPESVGNVIQTDKYMADISFYVEQSRHNEGFTCSAVALPDPVVTHHLRLENETEVAEGPWIVHSDDDIYADLTWNGDGDTFDYDLTAQGLAINTAYSLIYYADGWPGNNPGAFIGEHTTDASGAISDLSESVDLGMNLPTMPDGNFAAGAKIWLVLSSDYNSTLSSMTAWNPDSYLFEANVYINYTDTDL